MNIFYFINNELPFNLKRIITLSILSALSNTAVLACINSAAKLPSKSLNVLYLFVSFIVLTALYFTSQKELQKEVSNHTTKVIHNIRLRLMNKIIATEISQLEEINKEAFYNVYSKELQIISSCSSTLVSLAQSSVITLFILLYIAYLSLSCFAIILIFLAFGAIINYSRSDEIISNYFRQAHKERKVLSSISSLLYGFKEVKLNQNRQTDLASFISKQSTSLMQVSSKIQDFFAITNAFSQTLFFMLAASVVFIVPSISQISQNDIVQLTAIAFFVIGPISSILSGLPALSVSNSATRNISELESKMTGNKTTSSNIKRYYNFKQIKVKDLTYHYQHHNGDHFSIGPINLSFERGKVYFITGGNGSGKTTFARVLAGLFLPEKGDIWVDKERITSANIDDYRNLYSAIFADYYLFEQLFGLNDIPQAEIINWLKILEIDELVKIKNGVFDSLKLSIGQRKRLALLVSILENRPICIFDEWAAEQVPEFREKFYMKILPLLIQRGQTIIAISHDEKYFNCGDIHIEIQKGQVIKVENTKS